MKQCPTCGQQWEAKFQFCPIDRTPLGRKCPECGQVWDATYQFCPVDSAPLGEAAEPARPAGRALAPPSATPSAAPSAPAPLAAAPPSAEPSVPEPSPAPALGAGFTFVEQAAARDWKSNLFRPMTIIFAIGTLIVGLGVFLLVRQAGGVDLPPPVVKSELLTNEGKTAGVPVVIKVNQLAVFLIDDPLGEGTRRSQQIVAAIEEVIRNAHSAVGLRFAVETKDGRPAILVVTQAGPDPRVIASVTEGDTTLAGETDPMRVAGRWAERLTDAVKVMVYGEPPTFSGGTEFGESLQAMHKAAVGPRGRLNKKSLDQAFHGLPAAQRQALEAPPRAPAPAGP